jgi:hypothetical protein
MYKKIIKLLKFIKYFYKKITNKKKEKKIKLQEIRAHQALKEIHQKKRVTINHFKPETKVGDKIYTLIFPKFLLNYNNKLKTIDILFMGKITPKRLIFLNNFPNAKIINSNRGRNIKTKIKDEKYFKLMSKAKFTLCPNGDFIWTYRFFEAIIFKSIPIIEEECEIYKGYKFYKKEDIFIYRKDWINHNLNKLKNEMML